VAPRVGPEYHKTKQNKKTVLKSSVCHRKTCTPHSKYDAVLKEAGDQVLGDRVLPRSYLTASTHFVTLTRAADLSSSVKLTHLLHRAPPARL
jgi:hypothetical protein